jgi:hypothetical protein
VDANLERPRHREQRDYRGRVLHLAGIGRPGEEIISFQLELAATLPRLWWGPYERILAMKSRTQFLFLLFLSAAFASPASADPRPVAAQDLSRFIGTDVLGAANADLGVVSEVDTNLGLIGLAGKNGEFATLHVSLLQRDGLRLFAPTLNVGYIVEISTHLWSQPELVAVAKPTMTPTVTVMERPFIEQPKDQLTPQ